MEDTASPKPRQGNPSDYLSVADLARELGMTHSTIYSLLNTSAIPGAKLGGNWRVRRSDLEAIFDRQLKAS